MKTKNMYILAIGIPSLVFLIFLVMIPFVFFFYSPFVAVSIVSGLIITGLLLCIQNIPEYHMGKFHKFSKVIKIQKSRNQRFNYRKAKYAFSCAHAIIEILLERYEIIMTQDEILKHAGYKKVGMTSWELEETLNSIFAQRGLSLQAKTNYFTTYSQLFEAIQQGKGVIVMFMNHFSEEGFSSKANYPHFALLNNINMSSEEGKNRVILTSPIFSSNGHKDFTPGKYEGEIIIPFQEFQERFYASSKFINHLEYKQTKTENAWTNIWNKFLNFLFIFAFYIGYCLTVLKPGLAIFVEPVEKK